ncbi:hypothetical protein MNC86_22155 [Pantoea agglomerans]|uniref:hypothetical protein n=1 Tax=Enterobacter agglomerans TaxID=549 RepID=UPI001F4E4B50|nr:hypothetical protein [Pantoea agglomerans]MCH9408681.1 hypothetical protein [Pantoea agglomerans]
MTVLLLLGTLFSLIYLGVTHWFFPAATQGLVWYFGYTACYGLAAFISFRIPATSATEAVIVALKALLPATGAMLIIYGCFLQFAASPLAVGDADVLNTTSSMSGPLCIVAGIFMLIASCWMLKKN